MNLEKIWQESIRRKINAAKDLKEKEYYLLLEQLVLQINCECANCEVDKREWR